MVFPLNLAADLLAFSFLFDSPASFPSFFAESSQAPKFDVPLEPVTVNEGEKLSLKCHVIGSPPLKVQWMKDRRELKSSRETQITFVDGSVCLEVEAASKTDAGDYLCKASNAAGSTFCKSRVSVKGSSASLSAFNASVFNPTRSTTRTRL